MVHRPLRAAWPLCRIAPTVMLLLVAHATPVAGSVEAVNIGAVEARTGALLLSGQTGGEIDGALSWSMAGRTADGRATVPFVIEVDGDALVRSDHGRTLMIGIYAYVVDLQGRVVDYLAQGIRLDPELYLPSIANSGLKFIGRFDLAPGGYALRVLVRNHSTDAFFMSWSLVDVPADDDPALQLLPPLFPDLEDAWLVVRQAGIEALVEVGPGRSILPAARPTLGENRPAELYVGDHGWTPASQVGVRIINDLGRTVAEPTVEPDPATAGGAGFRRLALSPIDLPPGSYTLILTLDGVSGGEVLRRAVRVEVIASDERRTWATAAEAVVADGPPADEQLQRLRKRDLKGAYLEALSTLASGDADGARLKVARIERQAMVEPSPKARRELTETEQSVVKKLAAANPSSLAPIALLHRRLERSYVARNDGMLAIHARAMTVDIAENLGRLLPDDDFPAGLLVNVAVDLAQAKASSAARDLLERTLRIAPEYGPALLSLGFSFERSAEPYEASIAYDRLVAADPKNDEGRLRLAINLIRSGRARAGEGLLRELLDGSAPRWIEDLAAQELVRHLIDGGRSVDAEREARAALRRIPDDQRLWILLAAILDDMGRPEEAVDALRDLPAATRGVSPRARYAEWPDLGTGASQQSLAERARDALPALGSALLEVRK